ncbi:MAG: hypothetical protein DRJ10_02435 [Bacteroidetes bacterium]|nr:MAG: hypothetical protein DRJ10_02435 [Bacteroidota bacterium]
MKIYSYRIEHDFGLAPNPFGQYCTLVVCKPRIRKSKNLELGDWVIGTGSKALVNSTGFECSTKLIYAMRVTEKLTMQEYWEDIRFQHKRPMMKGTLITMFGDNFYHKDGDDNWIQEDSAHSNKDGTCNINHRNKDISGKNAIISDSFYYFGDNAIQIPESLNEVCHTTQGRKIVRPPELAIDFLNWLQNNFKQGLQGKPISWLIYNKLGMEK